MSSREKRTCGPGIFSASYTYDAYGPADRLLSVSGGSNPRTFGTDAAGRTTSVVSGAGTTTLAYDFESRLTSVSGPGGSASYVYNGLDTRVGKLENGVTNTFVRDGDYVTDPVLRDGAASYTPGISERRGTVSTYLHGGLKNPVTQGAANGTLSATRTYDAFGNVVSSTGTWRGPFGYAGAFGYQEDQTGLRLLGHRYYDSSTGRFLTRDPIKDGRNWYGYGAGESAPTNGVDPTGLATWTKGVGFGYRIPGVSTSGSIGIVIDPETGDVAITIGKGAGHAIGAGAGISTSIGHDPTGTINPGTTGKITVGGEASKTWGVGGELDFPLDEGDSDSSLDLSRGTGGRVKPRIGPSLAVYSEVRGEHTTGTTNLGNLLYRLGSWTLKVLARG